jgi:hypothetical protein
MNFGLSTLSQYDKATQTFAAWRFNGINRVGQIAYGETRAAALAALDILEPWVAPAPSFGF